ncbi:MAG: hypothetical protein JF886_12440 [Candidatus Dormibacteraeota bacterium]|uniref:STAS domain-containing protein n=1 Tax=Candidatus Aeolococcus gillhamiae TaxID=3127015 RepID=A0A2W6AZ37_9BACT|nr:hypothetical protein [Candidatus Dormibacteraeota bacterium]PZR83311.1 MAG: hypothetical protein DLM65_02150 [Candidatus Dormibacter sp. RRmetagenome_bin12]
MGTEPTLPDRARRHESRTTVPVDVQGICADAAAVDALARVQVAVRRRGLEVRLRSGSVELGRLIALMGLEDVLPADR